MAVIAVLNTSKVNFQETVSYIQPCDLGSVFWQVLCVTRKVFYAVAPALRQEKKKNEETQVIIFMRLFLVARLNGQRAIYSQESCVQEEEEKEEGDEGGRQRGENSCCF